MVRKFFKQIILTARFNAILMRRISLIFSIGGIFLMLVGCASSRSFLTSENYAAHKKALPQKIPALDVTMDYQSFTDNFIKTKRNNWTVNLIIQNTLKDCINDAGFVVSQDVKENIGDNSLGKNGYIVCKLTDSDFKSQGGYNALIVFDVLTACIPIVAGVPFAGYKASLNIQVEVRNIKNEVIATYSGHGTSVQRLGLYSNLRSNDKYRIARIEALKLAMDQVKIQMSKDVDLLTSSLTSKMEEIDSERENAIKQSLNSTETFLNANKKFDEGDYVSAINLYNVVLSEYPLHTYALINRGRAQEELKNFDAAIQDFSRVIELDPENADVFYYRGNAAYFQDNNFSNRFEAISFYDKAIDLSPKMMEAFNMRGASQEDLGFNYMAMRDYQNAVKISSDNTFARERLAIVKEKIQQEELAKQQQEVEARQAIADAFSNLANSTSNISSENSDKSTKNLTQSNQTDSKSTAKCEKLRNDYERQIQFVRRNIISLAKREAEDKVSGKLGMEYHAAKPNPALNVSLLHSIYATQKLMKTIREQAEKNGCHIARAGEEDIHHF